MDEAATRQGWVGPSHSPIFSSTHPNLSSHWYLRMTSSAATNDNCLYSVVLRCTVVQDKRYEELDRTARYGEDDVGWRNGLDVALAFGECNIPGPFFQYSNLYRLVFLCCVFCKDIVSRKPQPLLFEFMNVQRAVLSSTINVLHSPFSSLVICLLRINVKPTMAVNMINWNGETDWRRRSSGVYQFKELV